MWRQAYTFLLLNIDKIYSILADSPQIFDCEALPTSMNGIEHGVGCPGAVWMDGKPSKEYCVNNARYPWWSNCCTWYAGQCLPKTAIPKTLIETANRIDAEKYPISFEKHSYNFISYKSGNNKEEIRNVDPEAALEKAKACWDAANEACCCSLTSPCKFTLANMFVTFLNLGVACQSCVQDVIFGTCLKDELCDSGVFDSIEEVFKEKLSFLTTFGEKLASWLAKLVQLFIGECPTTEPTITTTEEKETTEETETTEEPTNTTTTVVDKNGCTDVCDPSCENYVANNPDCEEGPNTTRSGSKAKRAQRKFLTFYVTFVVVVAKMRIIHQMFES